MTPTEARARMVAQIAATGAASDRAVLDALSAVRREAFVPRFWAGRAYDAGGDRSDPAAVRLVYDMDRALAIRWDPDLPATATSTASAPALMASMLELLQLRPGLRVLEIGTGSGYNTALLARLVGDPTLVTSVDIDADLVEAAAGRLASQGYDGVRLLVADGANGVPAAAPYDRVLATVGCVDLSPDWLAQLTTDGFTLLPLQHGATHPLVRARPDGSAEVVGRSGFVAIQGHQAGRSPWTTGGDPPQDAHSADLPGALARALAVGGGRRGAGRLGHLGWWDLGFYVAISDRRAGRPLGLADGDRSGAAIEHPGTGITWYGPRGPSLRDHLLALGAEWLGLGRPPSGAYRCRFTAPAGAGHVGRDGATRWVVDRIDYRQTLRLPEISGSPR